MHSHQSGILCLDRLPEGLKDVALKVGQSRCRATAAQDSPWDRIPVSTRSVHRQLPGEAQIRLPCRSASSMEGFLFLCAT